VIKDIIYVIAEIVFLAIGVLTVGSCVWDGYRGLRSRSWPIADGIILASEIREANSVDGGHLYRYVITYQFKVRESDYFGHRLYFGDRLELPVSFVARRYRRRHMAGTSVSVFYNPKSPVESVLQPGLNEALIYTFAGGTIFVLFALLMLF